MQTVEKHYPENIRTEVFKTLMEHPIKGVPLVCGIRPSDTGWVVTEEYIPGQTLAEILRHGLLNRKKAVDICLRLCEILEQIHAMGLVHGDIKPENIIIGNDGAVYLIDFDASHFVKDEVGRDTVMMGTPGYASPEQYGFGRSDPRSDIYSMGVLLNIMMTGKHPLYESIDGRLATVVDICTDVDPDKRYQNVKDLKKGLKHPYRRHEFFPVGFRSMNPGKMVLAVIAYAAGIWLIISATTPNHDWEKKGFAILRVVLIAAYIGTIFIFFNYGGINNAFSKKKNSKHIAAKIVEEIIFLVILFIITLLLGHSLGAF